MPLVGVTDAGRQNQDDGQQRTANDVDETGMVDRVQ